MQQRLYTPRRLFDYYRNLDEDFAQVNLKKKKNAFLLPKEMMEPLWPNGKPISEAKLNDLKSLLPLIPEDAQDFYKKTNRN